MKRKSNAAEETRARKRTRLRACYCRDEERAWLAADAAERVVEALRGLDQSGRRRVLVATAALLGDTAFVVSALHQDSDVKL